MKIEWICESFKLEKMGLTYPSATAQQQYESQKEKNAGPEGQVLFEVKHCHLQHGLEWLHGPEHLMDKGLVPAV